MSSDTIFALSSGSPPAAVSIIRISGPAAHAAGAALAGRLPVARRAGLRKLRDCAGELLDEALVLRFDGPATSTGEDLLELHCHGGRAVVEAVLAALGAVPGLRPAGPGEFTRRAFENGRIDLTAAEGLADLIEAETDGQRRSALLLAEGGLAKQISAWQTALLGLCARAETGIEYLDDDSEQSDPDLIQDCAALAKELERWLSRPRSEPLREGVRVVLAGPSNAGKSSLFNALLGSDRAIVTDLPGTTRDHIDALISLQGFAVRLTDTAGMRETDEPVERIGVGRAKTLVALAEVLLWLGDPDEAPEHQRRINVHARSDLAGRSFVPSGSIPVSSVTGDGLDQLEQAITSHVQALMPAEGQVSLNLRQHRCISDAYEALVEAVGSTDPILLSESLRAARHAFDRLTGHAGFEDMLDSLFGRFCLGK